MFDFLNTYFGKHYEFVGTFLSWSVLYFKVHFLTDINLVDINDAINTASAFLSLVASVAGLPLTCSKIAEKLKMNKK